MMCEASVEGPSLAPDVAPLVEGTLPAWTLQLILLVLFSASVRHCSWMQGQRCDIPPCRSMTER